MKTFFSLTIFLIGTWLLHELFLLFVEADAFFPAFWSLLKSTKGVIFFFRLLPLWTKDFNNLRTDVTDKSWEQTLNALYLYHFSFKQDNKEFFVASVTTKTSFVFSFLTKYVVPNSFMMLSLSCKRFAASWEISLETDDGMFFSSIEDKSMSFKSKDLFILYYFSILNFQEELQNC